MKLANEKTNSITLVSLLGACTRILKIRLGKCIHSHIVTNGIELHVELETTLLGIPIGLIDAGSEYFEKMVSIYNIRPTMEHYGCMVDMFGRAGELEEAYDIIRSMSIEPNSLILRSSISACKHHGHIPCAKENIKKILLKIEPDLGSNYVLTSSLSYLFGYCSDVNGLRSAMRAKGIKKHPGSSWVQSPGSSSEGNS
ncbi:hypothetical protein H5410_002098 [Solanum commersonii]|uniref:Pentatricopeptide repeat-containing protein n=1 Tax=Solanum commersonii TaxID=4109 RepID=A0A9J6B0P7_SOLCO|nr:hypothetical protein H5410_002098 [Solanum commersonii]